MLTPKQERKYWRTWAAICAAQEWRGTAAELGQRRHALHRSFGLPESHKHWSNSHFSRWLHRTAPLLGIVDIRDRDRENAIHTITRLQAAFKILLGADYARAIMLAFGDTADIGRIPLRDASRLDLENLRNTLKNRLGRVIQRLKDGGLSPGPECPNLDRPQADIIAALTGSQPHPPGVRHYKLRLHPAPAVRPHPSPSPEPPAPAPAPAQRKYCMH